MRIKFVLYDFDGTLADTRELIVAVKQETMQRLGLTVESEEVCASTIGLPLKESFIATYPSFSDDKINECVAAYRAVFNEMKNEKPPVLFPGVKKVLSEIKELNITQTIASSRNTDSLNDLLAKMDIAGYFPYVLGGSDTLLNKPHPEPVLKTLKDLSAAAEETLVVGDMPYDIEMGKRAGVYTCGVTYGNSDRGSLSAAGADIIIDNITELPDIIRKF